ncbi:MAG: hypothetical protein HQM02_10610 [Magnetococcales bacterium]|nr:hypothetical protein [Magnetococcales bacterium]
MSRLALMVLGLITLLPARGVWSAPVDYPACLMQYVQPARSALAARHLQEVCARRFPPARPALAVDFVAEGAEEQAAYDTCLLRQLAPVHNDQSARWMVRSCQEQFQPPQMVASPRQNGPNGVLEWLQRVDGGGNQQEPPRSAPLLDGERFVPLVPVKTGP